jgi:hypothetical protein
MIKTNSQNAPIKKPAFQDDIVNEEFGNQELSFEGRRGSIVKQSFKRKDGLPKKKKHRKSRGINNLSVMDQI